jgi:hypothetical protein
MDQAHLTLTPHTTDDLRRLAPCPWLTAACFYFCHPALRPAAFLDRLRIELQLQGQLQVLGSALAGVLACCTTNALTACSTAAFSPKQLHLLPPVACGPPATLCGQSIIAAFLDRLRIELRLQGQLQGLGLGPG